MRRAGWIGCRRFVHEFVQQKVDVIVAVNNVVIRAAKEATKTIPIVMISSVDPVVAGYVESFAHPGGNITGLAWLLRDISAKRVELLKELLPKLSGSVFSGTRMVQGRPSLSKSTKQRRGLLKLSFDLLKSAVPILISLGAFQAAKTARLDALIVVANPLMAEHAKEVFETCRKTSTPDDDRGRSIRRGRWPDVLRSEFSRFIPARRRVRCRDLEGS